MLTKWWCLRLPVMLTPTWEFLGNISNEEYSYSYSRGRKLLGTEEIALPKPKWV